MRILTLTNGYPPHYYGGYELTCFDVMRRFRDAGHEVAVLTSTARVPGVSQADTENVRRDLLPSWDWETNQQRKAATPWGRLRVERHNLRTLKETLDDVRPDVVSVWHMIGLSMSLLTVLDRLGYPMVVTVGNDWIVEAPMYDPWWRMCQRWPFRVPTAVLGVPTRLSGLHGACVNFVSDFTRKRAVARGRWPIATDAPIAPPGIDPVEFPVVEREARTWTWRILYVGRVDPVKGIETLLRAFASLPASARLDILGRGPHSYMEEMKAVAKQLGVADRVWFDQCPRAELASRYADADAFVFPSEWDEPFGLVPIESMACGVPVVATATGGAAEFLHDGVNCLTYQAGSADRLADALRRLADDAELRRRLTTAGRDTARWYTIDRYAAQLLDLHHSVHAEREAATTLRHRTKGG